MAAITHLHDCDIDRRDDPDAAEGDFRDTHLEDEYPTTNYGTNIVNYAGVDAPSKGEENVMHMLLLYDLKAYIPAGATITAAAWWIYVASIGGFEGPYEYRIRRITRTDWVEMEATWNQYKSGINWTTAGGDMSTPLISFGDITTTGWNSYDILTMVSDAWSNRGGICTFCFQRNVAVGGTHGWVSVPAKDRYASYGSEKVHHLRITYTLDGRTFQAMLR